MTSLARGRRLAHVGAVLTAAACGETVVAPPEGPTPTTLAIVSGDLQSGPATTALDSNIVVRVLDAAGTPMAGVKVTFHVTGGGGALNPESLLTDFDGEGVTTWTLGPAVGVQAAEARVQRQGRSTLTAGFQATGVAPAHPAGILAQTRLLTHQPYGVAISSQGVAYITRVDSAAVTTANPEALTLGATFGVGSAPTDVAFHPSGLTAFVTNQLNQSLGVVTVAGNVVGTPIPLGADPFDVVVAADGSRIYVTTNANRVMAINAATMTVVDSATTALGPQRMALHPDGARLYVATILSGVVHEIHTATMSVARTFTVGGVPQGMAVSPDGSLLYIANQAGRVDIWDLAANVALPPVVLPGGAFGLAMTPDGAQLYVSLHVLGQVVVVSRQGRTIIGQIPTAGSPRKIAFTADGRTAVITNAAGWVDFIR